MEKVKSSKITKNLDIDDMRLFAKSKNIDQSIIDEIYNTLKPGENNGDYYISNVVIKSLPTDKIGGSPLLQIEPIPIGRTSILQLNINSDILAGRTLDEINKIIADSKYSVTSSLKEGLSTK